MMPTRAAALVSRPVSVWVACDPNPATDQVTGYHVFVDGRRVASPAQPHAVVKVVPGFHTFGLSAVNPWHESAQTTVRATVSPTGHITLGGR